MLARHGLHFGLDVKAFLKSTPSRAMRSKFGVLIQVQPFTPACVLPPQSSKIMNRMFGRSGAAAEPATMSNTSTAEAMRSARSKRVIGGAQLKQKRTDANSRKVEARRFAGFLMTAHPARRAAAS